MTQRDPGQHKPLWAKHREARRVPGADRHHRAIHHRHGFVFGFPNCSASRLDEFLDDSGTTLD